MLFISLSLFGWVCALPPPWGRNHLRQVFDILNRNAASETDQEESQIAREGVDLLFSRKVIIRHIRILHALELRGAPRFDSSLL